ncbi:MAG: hypothetical protein J5879_03565 [Clostridia bacterium]|nr:hypothetical protein [Clostridia bacterium]
MKRCLCLLFALAFLILCSCGGGEEMTHAGIIPPPAETKPVEVDDTVYISAKDYYNDGYSSNYVVGIDKLGRSFDAALPKTDKERQVGIFYFLTLGQHLGKYSDKIYDTSKILQMENGLDLMFSLDALDESIAPAGAGYFWGEPLFGYYNSCDVWVIRRHLKLLAQAGVDYLCFDVTNAVTYDAVYPIIMREICSLKEQGWENVPEVVFYTHARSTDIVRKLYQNIYEKGLYKESWYYYKGKPLIIAYNKVAQDKRATGGDYNPAKLSDEILDFFSFKIPEWPSEYRTYKNSLPWIEWQYPSPVHGDVINVAVASHPAIPMSASLTQGALNFGRGWSVTENKNISADAEKGTYFQSCWDVAIKEDPDMVFVTGWNEWVAGKSEYNGEYALIDLCNDEFSRDAEMMKGGYEDSFYMQLCENVRRYKSEDVSATRVKNEEMNIPMIEDTTEWNKVKAVFRCVGRDNDARSYIGAIPSVTYSQPAARNNIYEIRVCENETHLFFYIKTDDVIEKRADDDTGWMNIFIGTGELSLKGWCGYEYVINRGAAEGRTTIEKLEADFTATSAGEGVYYMSGNILQVKLPKSALGIEGRANIYFKVADGIEHPDDITDYYVSGKSLPMGRLSYRYLG